MRNLFIIGVDDHNMQFVEPLAKTLNCQFHSLLGLDDIQPVGGLVFREPLGRCIETLDAFDGPIDGIMGWWDFPVSTMLAVLRERYECSGPSVNTILSCEHKYHSRLLQREVAPEMVPPFVAVDPFDDAQVNDLGRHPGYPFWIKPIKAHSSQLGFRIDDERHLKDAIHRIRQAITRFGDAFDEALSHGELPPEVAKVKGGWCLAEGIIGGHQVTLEGYVREGEVTIPTIVDSVRIPGASSFARYQYPSRLPDEVRERMRERVTAVMMHHGYDEATFNVELYWDEKDDRLWILEINPRASQSHTVITEMVDGLPHLEAMAALALGEPPAPHLHSRGEWEVAAKHFIRVKDDAFVERVPSDEEVAAIERDLGCHVEIEAKVGKRLSELPNQDSYSFVMGVAHMGADNERALMAKFDRCLEALHFDLRIDGEPYEPVFQRGGAARGGGHPSGPLQARSLRRRHGRSNAEAPS